MSPLVKKRFKSSKCKTLAKLTLSRIKLLRNKKLILVKQSRRDVAELLRTGQESNAKIRVENVHREENSLAAYELIEQYCETIISRISTLESKEPCPSEIKEPVTSLMYAAQRCADLPELQKLRDLFTLKYGKEFAASASELRQDCGVSVQIIQSLSSHPPNGKTKLKLLKEIAAEHKITWEPSEPISESFKLSEDLLDGPNQFVSASEVSQSDSLAPTVSGGENPDSHRVVSTNPGGSSTAAPSPGARRKTFLSPYASRFRASISATSELLSSDRFDKISNTKGEFPPSGNYESLPQDVPYTKTKSHTDNRVKSPALVYGKGRDEEILSHRRLDNIDMQRDAHHGWSEADPYARAKAEGRMDYGDASFKARSNEAQHDMQPKEEKINDATQDSGASPSAHLKEEECESFNEEAQGRTFDKRPGLLHDMRDEKLARRPPSLKLIKSYSKGGKDGGSPYPDVATAAQVAFESAAIAAEAAKAAVDLVKMESEKRLSMQTDEADSFERIYETDGFEKVNEAKSKLRVEKVVRAMRDTHMEMDSQQKLQRITRPKEEISFIAVDDQLKAQRPKFDGLTQNLYSDEIFTHNLDDVVQQDESKDLLESAWTHQSTSSQREQVEKKVMQEVPRFDDYESDEDTDTDKPFYTKGPAAIGKFDKERYGHSGSVLSVSKPGTSNVLSRTTFSIPFLDHGINSGEESASDNQKFKMTYDRDCVKPEFDNNEEPAILSGSSISEPISHSLFGGSSHSEERLKGGETSNTGLRSESSPVNIAAKREKHSKSDKVTHHRVKWHSSASEEHGSSSQSGELLSETDERYSLNLHSHSGNDSRVYKKGWVPEGREEETVEKKSQQRLSWHSSASDELENPSHSDEHSPEALELRALKLPWRNEQGKVSHKSDTFIGPQPNRSSEVAEPYQAPKVLKGKPFYGESRRSKRSSRSQDWPDFPSPAANYDDGKNGEI